MIEAWRRRCSEEGKPFLGICVGSSSWRAWTRARRDAGLGWIEGEVRAISPPIPTQNPSYGLEHASRGPRHTLLDGIPTGEAGSHAYFVHSYHFVPEDAGALVASTDYGGPITALVARDNMAGTQFHPEKSQKLGLALIANFLRWRP